MYCGFGFCIILILRISLALISLKTELTIEGIQCEVSAAIKSEINRDGWWRLFGNFGDGLKEEIEGIQEVVQIGKCEVVDTWRQAWAWSSGLLCKIPFQIIEAFEIADVEKKLPYLIYFSRKCQTQRQSITERIFHPSLAMRARFVSFIRRNPNPPSLRGVHIELQDFRHRFLDLPLGKPHHKSLNILSSAEQIESGRRKVLIVYDGIEEAVAFMRTTLLAWERVLALQPSIFPKTLVSKGWNASFLISQLAEVGLNNEGQRLTA